MLHVITPLNVGRTQTTDFLLFVGHFFARPGEKMTYKKEKYHAAAGYNRFCVSPRMMTYGYCARIKLLSSVLHFAPFTLEGSIASSIRAAT
jgi:hypothetical protein